ncbi:toprim domain-containing protein [Geobacter pelophilus]|uniref:Toprim domain-containing protein n=1 Tax=Geoanaerobacter pelophilus TaxID=60036 RepID=A0AAW4L6Y4_9BACT|nr:toprim domain-containing protein [Geoanaerobacter pelophilus]MBT0664345.1 toprim domain-containing protein [Geoanaerobacter pelophilus]
MNDDPYHAISAACSEIGTAPPDYPLLIDSRVHRYHDTMNDRLRQKNGWYVAYNNPDGTTGGTVGSHKLQTSRNWCTTITRAFTLAEKAEFALKQAAARAQAENNRLQRETATASKAASLWIRSHPADPAHPYIIRKGIHPHRARQTGGSLVLDYRDSGGTITTLQFIDGDGGKRFLSNGRVAGSSHRFGPKITDCIILAEGFATGATLHEATGHPVCVCGSAGNIAPVAIGIREKFPAISIIIAGDADPVGSKAANTAAELVGGVVCLPDFDGERGTNGD